MGPGGLPASHRRCGPAPAGQVLLFLLSKEKISEQQKRLRALETQLTEEENLEIVRMVKAVKMDNRELTAFLKAYASGLITLPEGMMEAEAAADPGENEMEDTEYEE